MDDLALNLNVDPALAPSDLARDKEGRRFPPTPYARAAPRSPSDLGLGLISQPVSPMTVTVPAVLTHAMHVEDPMGVKKQWLMA